MLKKNILSGIILFLILGTVVHAGTDILPKKSIEIYTGGQKFVTFADYKLKKVRDLLRQAFAAKDDQALNDLLKKIQEENPGIDLSSVNEQELQTIVEKMKKEEEANAKPAQSQDQIVEMEEMLKEYQKEHQGGEPVTLDPHKVKTIVINPPGIK